MRSRHASMSSSMLKTAVVTMAATIAQRIHALDWPAIEQDLDLYGCAAVPQLVAPGEVGRRNLLPSFLYLPGPHDLPPGSVALPWDANRPFAVGEFARNHGSKIPGRLVGQTWETNTGLMTSGGTMRPAMQWLMQFLGR